MFLAPDKTLSFTGDEPSLDTVSLKRLVTKVTFSTKGVLGHACASRLDRSGYRLEETGLPAPSGDTGRAEPDDDLGDDVGAIRSSFGSVGFLEATSRLEEFVSSVGTTPDFVGVAMLGDSLQQWIGHGEIDVLEVFSGQGAFLAASRALGMTTAGGIDRDYPAYGRSWDLTLDQDQDLLALLVIKLSPKAIHVGIPCTKLCAAGRNSNDVWHPDEATMKLISFSLELMDHQNQLGRLASRENPVGSSLHKLDSVVALQGTIDEPKLPWRHVRSDGCQLNLAYEGLEHGGKEYGMPMEKGQIWTSNFCLSRLGLRCRNPDALLGCTHQHRQVKGSHKVEDETTTRGTRWESVAKRSGRYTPEAAAAYALSVRAASQAVPAVPKKGSGLQTAIHARSARASQLDRSVWRSGSAVDFIGSASAGPTELPVVDPQLSPQSDQPELTELQRQQLEEDIAKLHKEQVALWNKRADTEQWDEVRADMDVYRLCGESLKTDPRRTQEYQKQVLDGLGFGDNWKEKRASMTEADVAACREVLTRKAAGAEVARASWSEATLRGGVRPFRSAGMNRTTKRSASAGW